MKLTDKEIETALKQGRSIKRSFWKDSTLYISNSEFVYATGGEFDECFIKLRDVFADDWEII